MTTIYLVLILSASGSWQPFIAEPTLEQAQSFAKANEIAHGEKFKIIPVAYQEKL